MQKTGILSGTSMENRLAHAFGNLLFEKNEALCRADVDTIHDQPREIDATGDALATRIPAMPDSIVAAGR